MQKSHLSRFFWGRERKEDSLLKAFSRGPNSPLVGGYMGVTENATAMATMIRVAAVATVGIEAAV